MAQGATAAQSPNNVGGRRAWPPKPEKDWSKKVNRKERLKAKYSALAALADPMKVRVRGHQFDEAVTTPVVIEDEFEKLATTSAVIDVLDSIGVGYDLDRAKYGRKIRAGRGKMRDRRHKTPRSILIVVSEKAAPVISGANNLPGVQIVSPESLNTGLLAPGGAAGRLTVFSEAALKMIGEW